MSDLIPNATLNDGLTIPVIGFGTSRIRGNPGVEVIESAINNGYRLIDSAYNYENEGTVGEAIRRTSVSRKELIITSKLPGRYHEFDKAMITIQESLYRANLDYYDIYLVHWPNPITDKYVEAWEAMIEAKKRGYVRSIGVCNFLPEHMERLKKETGILPSMNQVELHPFFNQKEQRRWHERYEIKTQSWSPLARANQIFENDILQNLASKYEKTVAQIVLRWHYQLGAISIPRSSSPERQLENISIFDFSLEDNDMDKISRLNNPEGRLKGQDPATYEEF